MWPGVFGDLLNVGDFALVLLVEPAAKVELIASQGLSGKAAVFQTGVTETSPSQEKFAGSASACAAYTYSLRLALTERSESKGESESRGEVAERLKAAVC